MHFPMYFLHLVPPFTLHYIIVVKGSIGSLFVTEALIMSLLVFTAELYQISLSRCRERLALAETRKRSGKYLH